MTIPNLPAEELGKLAIAWAAGQVFSHYHIRPGDEHLIRSIFLITAFLDNEHRMQLAAEPPGLIYEYLSEAGPRAVNGYPCFFSMKLLNQDDTRKLFELVERIEASVAPAQESNNAES